MTKLETLLLMVGVCVTYAIPDVTLGVGVVTGTVTSRKEAASLSMAATSSAEGTSWSEPESRLKMLAHFADFGDRSSGVDRLGTRV